MNEQILKLAKQAMVERASGFKEFDADVFALLIVRECVDMCNNQSRFYAETENKGTATVAAEVCGIIIKQHFGVQE